MTVGAVNIASVAGDKEAVFSKDVSGPIDVTESNLHEYVDGVVVVNDVSEAGL